MVDSILLVDGVCIGWRGLGMGVLGFIGRLGLWLLGSASGAFYRVSVGRVFWNALLFLTNSARASMPLFVPKSVANWWSGAPSLIILSYSRCVWHSNTMCSRVCSSAPRVSQERFAFRDPSC
jgi:hypothetical protein